MLLCLDQPPRLFSQAVVLAQGSARVVAERVTGGFKDSFHDINPDETRYTKLFSASWVWADPNDGLKGSGTWVEVRSEAQLVEWELHWGHGESGDSHCPRQFPSSLLEIDDIKFYSLMCDSRLVGGVLFNLSGPVVGISNVFFAGINETELWIEIRALATNLFPNMPLTGYERGASLQAAEGSGFEAIGQLRVWAPR